VLAAVIATGAAIAPAVAVVAVVVLVILGALGARTGGAPMLRGALRVTFWGVFAMAVTAGVGALFGTVAG
jgi:VIT1/CCC1 family predicted Fe2+/Mn2+ transporter